MEVLFCVPARGRRLRCSISPFFLQFPKMQTCTPTFCFSFHISSFLPVFFFLLALTPGGFVSFLSEIQSQGVNLFSLYLSDVHFLSPLPHMSSSLSSSSSDFYRILPPTLPLYPLSHLLFSVFPIISSLSPSLTLAKVLKEGNEMCMCSVAAECGSRRENCCFMVLFMDL